MRTRGWLMVGVVALGMLLLGCAGPPQVRLDESANGTSVSLRAGQTLIIAWSTCVHGSKMSNHRTPSRSVSPSREIE